MATSDGMDARRGGSWVRAGREDDSLLRDTALIKGQRCQAYADGVTVHLREPLTPVTHDVLGDQPQQKYSFGMFLHKGNEESAESAPAIKCMALNRTLQCTAKKQNIIIDNVRSGTRERTIKCPGTNILCICNGEPEEVIYTGDNMGAVRKWSVSTGDLLQTFEGHAGLVAAVAYCFEDHTIFSGSADGTVRKWNPRTGECLKTMLGHSLIVTCLAICSRDGCIFSGSGDKTVKKWDVRNGKLLGTYAGHQMPVTTLKVDEEENTLCSTDWGKNTRLFWRLDTGALLDKKGQSLHQTTLLIL